MNTIRNFKLALAGVALAGLAACGGGGGGEASTGTLRLALTDAPACGYDEVNVTIQKVRVHKSSTASDTDGSWSEIVLNPARRVDLLDLTNGVLDELGQTSLPTGKYTQLRLVLAANSSALPLANSVVLSSDHSEVALTTPSGQQSGLKTNINIDIASNQLADFVLDFDACKSVVRAGNSGQYLLKPVLSIIPRYTSGVAGFVNVSPLPYGSATLSLQQGGVIIKATPPDSSGRFLLQPVAPGNYTLVLTAPERDTTIVTQVPVVANTVTSVNTSITAFTPAITGYATVNGSAPIDTLVRALQALTGGPVVKIAGQFVDGSTGAYSFPLVVNAPMVAPYVAAPGPLVFAPDTAAAGLYTLNASLSGQVDQTVVLSPLTAGATVSVPEIVFP
jgi:hypothetical protein